MILRSRHVDSAGGLRQKAKREIERETRRERREDTGDGQSAASRALTRDGSTEMKTLLQTRVVAELGSVCGRWVDVGTTVVAARTVG